MKLLHRLNYLIARVGRRAVRDQKLNNFTSQLKPTKVPGISGSMISVAVGRDHTVLVTTDGVWVWGSNQFGQCGFTLDEHDRLSISTSKNTNTAFRSKYHNHSHTRSTDSDTQAVSSTSTSTLSTPRKLLSGALRKPPSPGLIGCAASKIHSCVFSPTTLFVFGLNQGQLGIPISSGSTGEVETVQPRVVSMLPHGMEIKQVSCCENATGVLGRGGEVWVLMGGGAWRLQYVSSICVSNVSKILSRIRDLTYALGYVDFRFTAPPHPPSTLTPLLTPTPIPTPTPPSLSSLLVPFPLPPPLPLPHPPRRQENSCLARCPTGVKCLCGRFPLRRQGL